MLKRIVGIIALLLIASSALAADKKWFYSPSGPLFGVKKAPVTYTLNVPFTSSGIGSNSYDFNGTTHYVSVADADAFSPAAMSVCAWVSPDTISGTDTVLARVTAANYEFDLFLNAGVPTFRLFNADGTIYIGRSSTVLAADKWTYLCATSSDTSATGASSNIDILHNCVAVDAADSNAGVWAGITNGTSTTAIGSESAGANFYDGTMMNASVWNIAITPTICEDAMKASSYATYAGDKTNLVSWWDLQADVEDKHSTYEGTAQGGVAPASPTAYPFKDATNPVLLANGQVLDQSPDMWGVATGSLTVVDTSTGTVSLTGTVNSIAGAALDTTGFYSPIIAGSTGTVAMFKDIDMSSVTGQGLYFALNASASIANAQMRKHLIFAGGTTISAGDLVSAPTVGVYTNTTYQAALVNGGFNSSGVPYKTGDTLTDFTYGGHFFIKGGAYTNWTDIWSTKTYTLTNLYAAVNKAHSSTATIADMKVPAVNIPSIMQPYALDTFAGNNGDLLTAHTMDVGAGWTKRVADSVFDIDTNTAELETDGSDPLILPVTGRYVYIPTVADGITSLTVKCDATLNAKNGLMFRGKAEGATGMNAHVYELRGDGTNCDEYEILYNNDGGTALYSNAAGTLVNGTSYALTVQHIGNTIRMYRAGVKIGSDITSAVHNDGTWTGIYADTTSNTNTAFDTFSVHGVTTNGNGTSYNSFFTPYGY